MTYRFPDGTESAPTPFFGIALLRWMQQRQNDKVDAVVVVGTSTSMWDAWLEVPEIEAAAGDNAMELYGQLHSLSNGDGVTSESLKELRIALETHFGVPVRFCLVPFALTVEDQIKVLEQLAEVVEPEITLTLDVTHGFRHLPMLQLLSVFHLHLTKRCALGGAYYGALELAAQNGGVAPVVSLDFAFELFAWFRAIVLAEDGGDHGAVSKLLPWESKLRRSLARSAFLVRSCQTGEARRPTKEALAQIDAELTGNAGRFFVPRLRDILLWSQAERLPSRQIDLARRYLESNDYLRAAILATEAFISSHIQGADPLNYDLRDEAREMIQNRAREFSRFPPPWAQAYEAFRKLAALRNSMAHGTRSIGALQGIIAPMLADEDRMSAELRSWMEVISRAIESGTPPS